MAEGCVAFKTIVMKQSEHDVGNGMHSDSHAQDKELERP